MRAGRCQSLAALAAAAALSCGYAPPKECSYACVKVTADAGCVAGPPLCTSHCGGPLCPDGYALTPDAGGCGPMPVEDRLFCE